MPEAAIDMRINRVLLRYREAIARETERAYQELVALGVTDPGGCLPQRPTPPRRRDTALPR